MPNASELILVNGNTNFIHRFPISEKCGFAIRYRHSVALTPVTDYFFIRDGAIFLDRTEYRDFGAGLPHTAESGQNMRTAEGKIVIENFNRRVSPFHLRVGRVANHELILFDYHQPDGCFEMEAIPLKKIAIPGSSLRIESQ